MEKKPNRIVIVENTSLAVGGVAVDAAAVDLLFDGEIMEIVANVFDPLDTSTNNTKHLYEMAYAKMDINGNRPLTDGKYTPVRGIGGSSEIPGRDWSVPFKHGAKLNVSFQHNGSGTTPATLRVSLIFRCYDKEGPQV